LSSGIFPHYVQTDPLPKTIILESFLNAFATFNTKKVGEKLPKQFPGANPLYTTHETKSLCRE